MNKLKKIKAEIGIRIAEICDLTTGCIMDSKTAAEYRLLYELASFIDSLEEEPVSNDLEEAAWTYYDKNKPLIPHELDLHKEMISFFIAGAQWQKEQDQSTIELAEDHAMLAGMEKMKQEMMEDAVDGEIYFSRDTLQYRIITEPLGNFHHGDKVKLIIIKEE